MMYHCSTSNLARSHPRPVLPSVRSAGNYCVNSQQRIAMSSTCSGSGRFSCEGGLVWRRHQARRPNLVVRAEKKEYYDYKDMPPLPLTVSRIWIPSLGHTVVDKSSEEKRLASLAIFYDIYKDDQYRCVPMRAFLTANFAMCLPGRAGQSHALLCLHITILQCDMLSCPNLQVPPHS